MCKGGALAKASKKGYRGAYCLPRFMAIIISEVFELYESTAYASVKEK